MHKGQRHTELPRRVPASPAAGPRRAAGSSADHPPDTSVRPWGLAVSAQVEVIVGADDAKLRALIATWVPAAELARTRALRCAQRHCAVRHARRAYTRTRALWLRLRDTRCLERGSQRAVLPAGWRPRAARARGRSWAVRRRLRPWTTRQRLAARACWRPWRRAMQGRSRAAGGFLLCRQACSRFSFCAQ
jgi:hypothetical protein